MSSGPVILPNPSNKARARCPSSFSQLKMMTVAMQCNPMSTLESPKVSPACFLISLSDLVSNFHTSCLPSSSSMKLALESIHRIWSQRSLSNAEGLLAVAKVRRLKVEKGITVTTFFDIFLMNSSTSLVFPASQRKLRRKTDVYSLYLTAMLS